MRAGWPHYRGDFVRYRYVQGGHITGVILCGTDACRVATLQGRFCAVQIHAGWPHYRGDFVRYRYVQGGHITGVILCGRDACGVATLQG